jgi:cold shock CspA family protein
MALGYISRLLKDRGLGFVVQDGDSDEIEFHWSAVLTGNFEALYEGQRVEFERRPDHRNEGRFRAVNLRVVGTQ